MKFLQSSLYAPSTSSPILICIPLSSASDILQPYQIVGSGNWSFRSSSGILSESRYSSVGTTGVSPGIPRDLLGAGGRWISTTPDWSDPVMGRGRPSTNSGTVLPSYSTWSSPSLSSSAFLSADCSSYSSSASLGSPYTAVSSTDHSASPVSSANAETNELVEYPD